MAEHVLRRKFYFLIWLVLIGFTFGTWGIALIDLGRWNIVVAMIIALIKASLVVLFFMHMKYSPQRTQLALVAGIFWMMVLLGLTLSDYATRSLPSSVSPPIAVAQPADQPISGSYRQNPAP